MHEYPLAEKTPETVRTPSGLPLGEVTLDAILEGRIAMEDLRVTADALERQAAIAESAGRPQLAENLRRASELVGMPEARILEIYNALRPGRACRSELLRLAQDVEAGYGASRCAALIREAAGAELPPEIVQAAESR
jgi:propanediol dehydratase small subunit